MVTVVYNIYDIMSLPVSYSLTDEQIDELMDFYETSSVAKVKTELRSEIDEMVDDKIDEK